MAGCPAMPGLIVHRDNKASIQNFVFQEQGHHYSPPHVGGMAGKALMK